MAIIPQFSNRNEQRAPKWLDSSKVNAASTKQVIVKQASTREEVVTHFSCTECARVFPANTSFFLTQRQAALKAGKDSVELTCPECQGKVAAYKSTPIKVASLDVEQPLMIKDAGGETNSFVDRHVQYKAINELSQFGNKNGMHGCVARYIKADHVKMSGADYPILNNFECILEWQYGRKQKARVTATIAIDTAGKYIYPTTFKTAGGKEYPFTKDYLKYAEKDLTRLPAMPTPRKTDQPEYKKVDPSNFRAASLEGEIIKVKDFVKQ